MLSFVILLIFFWKINISIKKYAKPYIFKNIKKVPNSYTILVLGAKVFRSGMLSDVLEDRVESAYELYQNKKGCRFLLSGDHGQTSYDEVNHMKNYLLKKGVPQKDIFLDHAGFRTYDSIIRAKKVFLAKNLIVVTQKFHLPRAIYIARKNGLNAYGYIADKRKYFKIEHMELREYLASIKAFWDVLISKKPKYLGHKIPITGNSRLSWD